MANRIKIPKRLAGVKIPKGIRKGPIINFLNTPAGQVVLAQAVLLIGGGFAAAKAGNTDAIRHPLETLKDVGRGVRSRADGTGEKLTRAIAAAAHAFRDVMEGDDPKNTDESPLASATTEEVDPAARDSEPGTEPEVGRKKSRVRSEPPSTPH